MKKMMLMAVLAIMFCGVNAQTTVKRDSLGIYTSASVKSAKVADKKTGDKYRDSKGNLYDIYIGSKGGKYILKTKKDGTQYKAYLKLEN
jgi:hypothetical protein